MYLIRWYSFHPEESRPLAVSTDGMSFYCLFPIISYCGGISPLGGLDTAVLPAGHSTQGDFYSIISYCGGISPLGGLDTVVLPAGHSTQGDLSFVTYRLHGILRPSNLTLGDVAIY